MGKWSVTALIVAAGSGERVGGDVPKQYRPIAGKPMLRWAIEAMQRHPRVTEVRVVIGKDHDALFEEASRGLNVGPAIVGGATRQKSVLRGLEALAEREAPKLVLIH